MGVKGDNLELISGLLLSSFILNYMLIRVKEEGLNKKNRKNKKREKRSIDRERGETKRKAKLWKSRFLDHEFFGGGRLWFMLFHSRLLTANGMYG